MRGDFDRDIETERDSKLLMIANPSGIFDYLIWVALERRDLPHAPSMPSRPESSVNHICL
jgi:hypothetical protein